MARVGGRPVEGDQVVLLVVSGRLVLVAGIGELLLLDVVRVGHRRPDRLGRPLGVADCRVDVRLRDVGGHGAWRLGGIRVEGGGAYLRRRFRDTSTKRSGQLIVGRPRVNAQIKALVTQMAAANPLWGAPRIHGELINLGIDVSERTVSRLMPKRSGPPSQTWRTFRTNHVQDLVSIDFFTVPTLHLRVLSSSWSCSPTIAAASSTSP